MSEKMADTLLYGPRYQVTGTRNEIDEGYVSRLERERDSLKRQLAEANAELDLNTELMRKQNVALAEMRKALEIVDNAYATPQFNGGWIVHLPKDWPRIMASALSSDAGKDLLERVRYLEQGHQLLKDLLDDVYMLDPMGSGNRVLSGPPKRSLVDTVDAFLKRGGKDA